MNKLKIVAILIGIEFMYFIYSWAVSLYQTFSQTHDPLAFLPSLTSFSIVVIGGSCYFQFLATRFKKSQLLRAFLFYQCFSGMLWLVNWVLFYVKRDTLGSSWEFFRVIMFSLMFLGINFLSLILLQKVRIPKYETLGRENAGTFSPVGKNLRFIHCLIDLIFISVMFASTIVILRIVAFRGMPLFFYGALSLFVYYFVMETIFKVTLGKIFTKSIVVNGQGQKAGSWDILKRALSRFIPFDALSFLFSECGWHDQLSDTYVIHDKYEWETERDAFDTYFTGEPESEPTTTLIP